MYPPGAIPVPPSRVVELLIPCLFLESLSLPCFNICFFFFNARSISQSDRLPELSSFYPYVALPESTL